MPDGLGSTGYAYGSGGSIAAAAVLVRRLGVSTVLLGFALPDDPARAKSGSTCRTSNWAPRR